jgi:hypothetical protein
MKRKVMYISGIALVLASLANAAHIEHVVLGSNVCTQQFWRLVCDDGCAPRVTATYKCCSTMSGNEPNCCQRLCYNVICEPEIGGPPSCSGSASGNVNSLGNLFTGPCQSNGLCSGTPPGWQGPGSPQ